MKRAEMRQRLQAILFYRFYTEEGHDLLGVSIGFPTSPERFGKEYAENMGYEIRATFRAGGPADTGQHWDDFINHIKRGKEKHLLMPNARSIPDLAQWERLVRIIKRTGKVLHFFNGGSVYHSASTLSDVLEPQRPLWMMRLCTEEGARRRLTRKAPK